MKPVNIFIVVLVVALLCSSYFLADAVFKRMNNDRQSLISKILPGKDNSAVSPAHEPPPTKAELEVKEALLNTQRPPVLPPQPTINAKAASTETQHIGRTQSPPEKKETRPVRDIKVVMYMTSWCPYCKKARDYINSQGAALTEYDIERDRNASEEMARKTGGSHGVPVVDVEGIIIRGYSPEAISTAIRQKQNP
jgi:glutaredoxin